jgi:hypothetical protein
MQEKLELYYKDTISIGILTKEDTKYKIELRSDLHLCQVPFLFRLGYERGKRKFYNEEVEYWIDNRSIPSNRHNIDEILREAGLKEYDQWELLKAYKGRNVQDEFSVRV